MKRKLQIVLVFAASLVSSYSFAQDATATETTKEEKPKITMSGYIDSYYLTSFNSPKSGNLTGVYANSPAATNYARAFDRLTDQFALGLVQTKFAYSDAHSDLVI